MQDDPARVEDAPVEDRNAAVLKAGRALQQHCHAASYDAGWWHHVEKPPVPRATIRVDLREQIRAATGPADLRARLAKALVNEKLLLVVSEISEAMEGWRKDARDDKLPHRQMIEVELADAVIRIADLAGALDLDLGAAIAEKMAYNAVRADHKPENRAAAGGKAF